MDGALLLRNPKTNMKEDLMPLYDSRPVLWRNVSALMRKKYGRENLNQLAREAQFSPATSTRIKEQSTSVGIDVLDKLAMVFGVLPNQLLDEQFDAMSAGIEVTHSPLADDLARQLDAIGVQSAKERAYALATQVLALASSAPTGAPSPAPQSTSQQTTSR